MLILKLCGRAPVARLTLLSKPIQPRVSLVRSFGDKSKFRTAEQRRKTLSEVVTKPAGESGNIRHVIFYVNCCIVQKINCLTWEKKGNIKTDWNYTNLAMIEIHGAAN